MSLPRLQHGSFHEVPSMSPGTQLLSSSEGCRGWKDSFNNFESRRLDTGAVVFRGSDEGHSSPRGSKKCTVS